MREMGRAKAVQLNAALRPCVGVITCYHGGQPCLMEETPGETVRVAMWSGPRNISTALMRAWENRPDTEVSDEPFFGYYLHRTGVDHPGRDEVIRAMRTDWREIVDHVTGPPPDGRPVWYQKHMAHHILPEVDLARCLGRLRNCFLIRDPREVVASYERVRSATPEDLGYARQVELFHAVARHQGAPPPVLDSSDVLADPEKALRTLCRALRLPFQREMLNWPAGPRDTDGVWAKYWYASVEASTGFSKFLPGLKVSPSELSERQAELAEACRPFYETLRQYRIGGTPDSQQ